MLVHMLAKRAWWVYSLDITKPAKGKEYRWF